MSDPYLLTILLLYPTTAQRDRVWCYLNPATRSNAAAEPSAEEAGWYEAFQQLPHLESNEFAKHGSDRLTAGFDVQGGNEITAICHQLAVTRPALLLSYDNHVGSGCYSRWEDGQQHCLLEYERHGTPDILSSTLDEATQRQLLKLEWSEDYHCATPERPLLYLSRKWKLAQR